MILDCKFNALGLVQGGVPPGPGDPAGRDPWHRPHQVSGLGRVKPIYLEVGGDQVCRGYSWRGSDSGRAPQVNTTR